MTTHILREASSFILVFIQLAFEVLVQVQSYFWMQGEG